MSKISSEKLALFNENVRFEDPAEIISFALEGAANPIVSTSFGPYSAALLHACTQVMPDIQVIWCDTGYNTEATYRHAYYLMNRFQLNIEIFTPEYTTAFIDSTLGHPRLGDPRHSLFSKIVKLDPFDRALEKYQPDVWFTNVRNHQTTLRNSLDVFSLSKEGILKVSPFYYFSNEAIESYLKKHQLPLEADYFDPVKALEHRECGIHLKH